MGYLELQATYAATGRNPALRRALSPSLMVEPDVTRSSIMMITPLVILGILGILVLLAILVIREIDFTDIDLSRFFWRIGRLSWL